MTRKTKNPEAHWLSEDYPVVIFYAHVTPEYAMKLADHDMGDMTYTMFMNGDKSIAGMLQTPKDKIGHVPPHWMSYIGVDDIEKTFEKAKSLGANVIMPVTKAGDMGRFIVIQDPTGAHIAFWQCNESSCK